MNRAPAVLAAIAGAAIITAGILGWSAARAPHTTATSSPSPTSTPTPAATAGSGIAALTSLPLAAPGSELTVGTPGTVRLDDVDGTTIYATVTMSEIQQLPDGQAAPVLSAIPALAGYTTVYEMPVSLTVIGIITAGGTRTAQHTGTLTADTLARFTIATHPGSDPLPGSDTLSDGICTAAPQHAITAVGQTVQWCIHAFATPSSPAPAGGQYRALTGTYSAPVFWASKTFASSVVIP